MDRSLTRRDFLRDTGGALGAASLAGLLPTSCATRGGRRTEGKPGMLNVLYIMTDQQRADTLGCYGNPKVETPHLDRLASEGVRFDSCYATQPVCSPCRASMATGLYPHATGVVDNCADGNPDLPRDLFTWPEAFREAGYRTAYVGKWHLGCPPVPNGIEVWHGYNTGWPHWIDETGQYRPDEETDFTLGFLRENRDRPFMCWLSWYPPHTPKTVPDEDYEHYRGRFEDKDQDLYHAMVRRLDWNVGRILKTLDELELREKTLVVFTSDHGENFPLRWNNHHKRLCYDASACVPLIWSLPGVLPRGAVRSDVISMVDVPITILDQCGLSWPADLHGRSASRLLQGDPAGWHDAVFIENAPYRWDDRDHKDMRERCVVTGDWKLILNNQRPPELFDRRTDRGDARNLYSEPAHTGTARDLAARLRRWGRETRDPYAETLADQWFG